MVDSVEWIHVSNHLSSSQCPAFNGFQRSRLEFAEWCLSHPDFKDLMGSAMFLAESQAVANAMRPWVPAWARAGMSMWGLGSRCPEVGGDLGMFWWYVHLSISKGWEGAS